MSIKALSRVALGACVLTALLALAGAALVVAWSSSEGAPRSPLAARAASTTPTPVVEEASQTPAPPASTPTLTVTPTPSSTPPWVAGTPWPGPGNLPILMYHHVSSAPPASEFEARLTVTEEDFSRQLDYLRCAGYATVTLSQLFDGIYNGAPLPAKPLVLSFDDGFADAFTNAFPRLRERGFGAAYLIVVSFVGQPGYVTWDQVREMSASGMEIVSHSVNHANLDKEPDDVVRRELAESKRILEEQIGKPVEFFGYPAGEPFYHGTPERQQQVVAMVREAGYRGALAVKNSLIQDPAAPFALSRLRVTGGVDIRKFAANMGGPLPEAVGC